MTFANFMALFWYANMTVGLWCLPYLESRGQAIALIIFFGCAGLACTLHSLGTDRQTQKFVKETFRVRG